MLLGSEEVTGSFWRTVLRLLKLLEGLLLSQH